MAVVQGTNTPTPKAPPKRKPEPNPFEAIAQTITKTVQTTANTAVAAIERESGGYEQVGLVDAQSYRLLPSEVVLDIAGLGFDEKDIVRASRMLAAQYDVSPRWVFGVKNPRAYLAKQTGKPVTLHDMQRITDAYAPAAIAAMLEDAEVAPSRKVAGADAKRIGQVANLLAREYGGLDIATGIALAQKLVLDGITPKKFERNFTIARQWASANGVTDETTVFQAALAISRGGIEALVPPEVEEIRAAQRWAIEQGITTREQIERLSADNAAIARATGDSSLLAFNQDYWAEIQRASARVQLTQDAFSRSILGKTLGVAGELLTNAWQATQVSLIEIGTDLVTGPVIVASALGLDPQGDTVRENWDMLRRMRTYATQRINMGDTVGDLVEEGYTEAGLPLPAWTSTAFDFAVGWYVDPFVIAGKVGRVARGIDPLSGSTTRFVVAAKTLPRLDESLKLTERIFLKTRAGVVEARVPLLGDLALSRRNTINDALAAGFNKYVTQTLPTSRLADKLFDAAYKSNHAFFRELDLGTPGRIVGRALDYEYMKFVRSKLLERFPTATKEAREAFGEALSAHFVGFGPEGSIAEAAVKARIDRAKRAVEEGVARGAVPEDDLALALSEHLALGGENAYHIPFTLEGPNPRGFYGPRRLTRRAMTSQSTTQYALGRRIGNLRNINPGRILNPHDLPDEYILMHSRRWNVFDEREVRAYQSRVDEITARGGSYRVLPNGKSEFVGMETALANLADEINDEAFKRIIKPYNLSDDASKTLYDSIFGEVQRQNYQTQTFLVRQGAKGKDEAITVPQLETQLRNSIFVVDPITVRSAVREYTGFGRRANAHLQKALKGVAPEIAARVDRNLVSNLIYQGWGHAKGAGRFYQRMWKGLTVARPGYIPRVILGDENARFLVTTRSFTERLLSQEWYGLTSKLDDTGWFDEVFTIGDDTVRIGLPGAYERNPLAAGTIRQSELITEMMRDAQGMFKNLTPTGSWKPLKAVDGVEVHAKAWEWVLQKQFAKSRPGQIALESVAKGDDITATREALIAWARDDKFVTLRTRIGMEPKEFDAWFTDVANAAHAYTMRNPAIATAALAADAKDLRKLLNGTKIELRPTVHGPGVDAMFQGDTFTKGLVNRAYEIFVRKPEDVLNRQPFYKTWKRRAEVSYMEALSRSGAELTPALTQAIDTASMQFALEQVRKVMFDLTRQSRFTELLQFIFPFPQPFFEGFQTWGAIAMRNPEGIGRIMQLFRTGVETGFIKKDEMTGEYVVGMDVFRRAMPILHALGIDESGRVDKTLSTFVAPLTSFNMLASTTIKFGPEGFVGKVIGGVPIPVPGMHVPASLVLQGMFADSNSIPATSYLFQYGPSTTATLLPTQVKLWLSRVMPEQFPDKQAETLAYSILRSYQVQGLDVDSNGDPIPLEELERMATEDAKELAFVRGLMSLLSPASLRVKTVASPYEAEWQELVSSSESYFAAIDEWNTRHPTLSYVPIGKTFYDAGFIDPATGAEANAPRLPTSAVVAELLTTPGVGDFMKANPQWAGLVLIGLDPKIVEAQDFATYSRLLSNGMLKYKPIAEFLAEGDRKDGVVWNEIDRWYRDFYDPQYTNLLTEGGLDEEDPAYKILRADKREFLTMIATQHPAWAKQNLVYHEDGDYWDWPGGETVDKPIDLVLADARRILDTPGFQDAPGFQALGAYLDLHDEYIEKMRKRGYYDIFQDSAQEDGLTAAYAREVKAIIDGTPGIDAFLSAYFGVRFEGDELLSTDDLRGVTRDYDVAALHLSPEMEQSVTQMNLRYEQLRDAAQTGFNYAWERSERYNDAARYFDRKFFTDRKTFNTWWKLLGKTGQEEYKAGLVGKPAVFYSAFDLHLSGVDVTRKQSAWLSQIADARVQIAKNEEANPEYSESSGYEAINKQVRAWMNADPKFAEVIDRMNSWTLALRTAGYADLPGKTGHIWNSLLNAADDAQAAIDRSGVFFTGSSDYDTDNAQWWDAVQDAFIGWVERKAKVHKPFAETWRALTKDLQDPIIGTLLVPDTYYPMGRVED